MADDVRNGAAAGPGHPAATAEPAVAPAGTSQKGINLPYTLPSRGALYGGKCPGGKVIIYPIRGEQEELLAFFGYMSSAVALNYFAFGYVHSI